MIGCSMTCETLYTDSCCINEAAELVERHHYAGRMPSRPAVVRCFAWRCPGGLFGDAGPAAAAAVFALPGNQYLRETGCIELARIARTPDLQQPLSRFIAWTVRRIATEQRPTFIISYADAGQGHHGGLYQAVGWNYLGTAKCYQTILTHGVTGDQLHGREVARRFGTQHHGELRKRLIGTSWQLGRAGDKHVYVRPITIEIDEVCRVLGRRKQPYPKPDVEKAV